MCYRCDQKNLDQQDLSQGGATLFLFSDCLLNGHNNQPFISHQVFQIPRICTISL